MKPEIDDAITKAKDFATSSRVLTDTFYENPHATDKDKQYLKDTEDKYNQLKDEWSN